MNFNEFGYRGVYSLPAIIGNLLVSYPGVEPRLEQLYPIVYWGTLLIAVCILIYAVLGLFEVLPGSNNDSGNKFHVGTAFEKGKPGRGVSRSVKPDQNGKIYFRFRLIEEGAHKGFYVAVPNLYFTRSYKRDELMESEMRDIHNSGFDILTVDPKSPS